MRMELDTLIVQNAANPDNGQFINSNEVSGRNSHSSTVASPPASFSQQPQHASTASAFSPNGQKIPRISSNFSTDDMSLGIDLGSTPSCLGGVVEGQASSESGTGLDISDLDIWSSIILQDSEDLPAIRDVQSTSPWL